MMSSSGTLLLPDSAIKTLIDRLIPITTVLTPNLPEASALLGKRVTAENAASELLNFGAASVLVKGGHARGRTVVDHFVDSRNSETFFHKRLSIRARGTGCVLASAIAANLALGKSRLPSVRAAERFLQYALQKSVRASDRDARLLLSSSATKK
jgi:hydroxymethylpyrimidine/phosphomethylpyrimidine kinase